MQAAVHQLSLQGIGCMLLGVRAEVLTTDHRQVSLSTTRACPIQHRFFTLKDTTISSSNLFFSKRLSFFVNFLPPSACIFKLLFHHTYQIGGNYVLANLFFSLSLCMLIRPPPHAQKTFWLKRLTHWSFFQHLFSFSFPYILK